MFRVLTIAAICCGPWIPPAFGQADPGGDPQGWLGQLADPDFEIRERAGERLGEWAAGHADEAGDLLFEQSVGHGDPEVRMRCRELLRDLVIDEFHRRGQGFVGIGMQEVQLAEGGFGIRIIEVRADTPAAGAGLRVGDVIIKLNGEDWDGPGASELFREEIKSGRPGDVVRLKVQRRGLEEPLEFELKLMRRPPDQLLLFRGLRIDPRQLEQQEAEMMRREEQLFFEQWLELRLRQRDQPVPPAPAPE